MMETLETIVPDHQLAPSSGSGLSLLRQILITTVFVVGATGNTFALWILYKSARTRNRKHVLMLRCLATNDLVAQVGMLSLLTVQKFELIPMYWICVGYVLLRAFGIGSGCVAFVMALERWLALTRPFFYQQVVTYRVVKRFLFSLWCGGAFLTYLPLLGFGFYYGLCCKNKEAADTKVLGCCRYREAVETKDVIYAYLFLVFGTCLCCAIAVCNLTVIWELSRIRSQGRVLVRRVSRSIINNRVVGYAPTKYQTPEEVAFAKLMAVICIIFVVCWAPQMISIPMSQSHCETGVCRVFYKLPDLLMCVYFTLDPYVYVLQRYWGKRKHCLPCFYPRRSTNNITSNGTPPDGTPTSVLLQAPSYTTTTSTN